MLQTSTSCMSSCLRELETIYDGGDGFLLSRILSHEEKSPQDFKVPFMIPC